MSWKRHVGAAVSAALLTTGLAVTAVTAATAATAAPVAPAPPPPPTVHTDVFPGAKLGQRTGPAAIAPAAGARSAVAASGVNPAIPITGFTCDDNSGARVEVLYVRETGMPDRYDQLQALFQTWLLNIDHAYTDSAAKSGQSRHLRFLTETVNGSCQAVIRKVELPVGALDDFGHSTDFVKKAGYADVTDRKYLMLTEGTTVCGAGGMWGTADWPGQDNWNNAYTTYARVDAIPGCWGSNALLHELTHSLGSVVDSAPHRFGQSHCYERYDIMCYGDGPTWAPLYTCTEWNAARLLDCNGDDYFKPSPAAGSYLDTHWNLANSRFLNAGATADAGNWPRPGSVYTVRNVASNLYLDTVNGSTASEARLSARAANGSAGQKWLMRWDTGMQLMNSASRLCGTAANGATTAGSGTWQIRCDVNDPPGQSLALRDATRWGYLPHNDGTYSIVNWKSGLALAQTNGSNTTLLQQPYTGVANQRWAFTKVAVPGPVAGSVTTVRALSNRDNVVAPAGSVAGTPVSHAVPDGTTQQRWRLEAAGTDWRLVNTATNLCLNAATTTAWSAVTQAACSTTPTNQRWTFRKIADGTYHLVNRFSGLALAITDGAGSELIQLPLNIDDLNQQFFVTPV